MLHASVCGQVGDIEGSALNVREIGPLKFQVCILFPLFTHLFSLRLTPAGFNSANYRGKCRENPWGCYTMALATFLLNAPYKAGQSRLRKKVESVSVWSVGTGFLLTVLDTIRV